MSLASLRLAASRPVGSSLPAAWAASAATLTLTANNTYTGATTVSSGTLLIGTGGTAGSVAGDIVNNAAVSFNRSDALVYSGAISGNGTVTKRGAGTLVLEGANSYAGATSVAAGATYAYEIDSTNPLSLGAAADLLVVNGGLNLDPGNGSLLTVTGLAGSPNFFVADTTTFALINYSGAWNGGLFTYAGNVLADGGTFTVGSQQWMIDYDLTSSAGLDNFMGDYLPASKFVAITALAPVPEPSTSCMALAGLACGGFSMWRRRKRARRVPITGHSLAGSPPVRCATSGHSLPPIKRISAPPRRMPARYRDASSASRSRSRISFSGW